MVARCTVTAKASTAAEARCAMNRIAVMGVDRVAGPTSPAPRFAEAKPLRLRGGECGGGLGRERLHAERQCWGSLPPCGGGIGRGVIQVCDATFHGWTP